MSTITRGRIVDFTYRRRGDDADITRPALVTEVIEAKRAKAPDPMRPSMQREYELAPAVKLVVFDERGSFGWDQAVFEDAACESGAPKFQHWGWPAHARVSSPPATAESGAVKGKNGKPRK